MIDACAYLVAAYVLVCGVCFCMGALHSFGLKQCISDVNDECGSENVWGGCFGGERECPGYLRHFGFA